MFKNKYIEYKNLSYIEKKIVARKHSAETKTNGYSFPIMVILIIISYYIYKSVTKYIIFPIITIAIILYVTHEIKVRKWYKENKIKLEKKDLILYGTNYEIEKVEKGCNNVQKKVRKTKKRRTEKNI